MTNIRRTLCHAEFTCVKCGKPFEAMALAPFDPVTMRICGDAVMTGKRPCNDCCAEERKQDELEWEKARKQRAWARKAVKTVGRKGIQ